MKKLLVWFLAAALLLAPLSAFGEGAVTVTARSQWSADTLSSFLSQMLPGETEETVAKAAGVVAALGNAASFRYQLQPDGLRVALDMNDAEVAYGQLNWDADGVTVTSTLLPGCALFVPVAKLEETGDSVRSLDWAGIWADVREAADAWVAALDPVEERGSFAGDAYEGAVLRRTISLDDRDVALLVDCVLLRLEERQDVADFLAALAGEGWTRNLFAQARAYNQQAALANRYSYRFSENYADASGTELIGISFTSLDEGVQETTLSLGLREDGVKAVLGVTEGDGVTYLGLDVGVEREDRRLDVTAACRAASAGAGAGFEAACQGGTLSEDVQACFSVAERENGLELAYALDGRIRLSGAEEMTGIRQAGSASLNLAPFSLSTNLSEWLGDVQEPIVMLTQSGGVSEPFAAPGASLERLLPDAPDARQKLDEALSEGLTDLGIALFRHVPAETLTTLLQILSGQ